MSREWSSSHQKTKAIEEKQRILSITSNDQEKGCQEISQSKSDRNEPKISSRSNRIAIHEDDSCRNYFNDGTTKIDFVLVYEETHVKPKINMSDAEKALHLKKTDVNTRHKKWRKKFLKNLHRKGVQIERDENTSPEKTIHYFKLHCPWELLVNYAEELNLRAPLQTRRYTTGQWSAALFKKCRIPNHMKIDVPNPPKLYYTCKFKKSKLHNFLGSNDRENYFSTTDRMRIMYEVLQTTIYGKKRRAEIGIDSLVAQEAFSVAFPLHDGSFKAAQTTQEVLPSEMNERQVLYEFWAKWGRWYKYQPLDHIRHYFGEKIGMYFAWLGFYTAWLLPVAIIGLLVFIIGAASVQNNTPAVEICRSGTNYTMCPLCTICSTWYLSSTCVMAELSYLFDNGGTVFFAILMSFWAVFFLEFWKRKRAKLAHHWEVMNFEEEDERPRPEYVARAPKLEMNPVTGVIEPHFSPRKRMRRIFAGSTVLLTMLVIVVIFVVSVIIYKGIIGLLLFQSGNEILHGQARMIQTFSGAIINLILIMLMANVYTALAEWITRWEMHRTQTEYESSLTTKVFIFQFFNYYSSILYIAFFKGNLVGYPGNYGTTLGIRNEDCSTGGCLVDLAQQLFVIMVGKQIINNVQELLMPKLRQWWQSHKMKKSFIKDQRQALTKSWEVEYHTLVNFQGLFDEYLEMVLQFGFITIFVAAFPLAPLLALLNNWIEIRLDARKLVCETRRPVADRAQSIGVWYEILEAIVRIAVIVNAFLIAFTSEFIPRTLYTHTHGNGTLNGYTDFSLSYAPNSTGLGGCRYKGYRDREGHRTMHHYKLLCARLAFVIAFEHVVFFIGRMIDTFVPDVPEDLLLRIKRENFLAKQALSDNFDTNVMDEVVQLYSKRSRDELEDAEAPTSFPSESTTKNHTELQNSNLIEKDGMPKK